jgi:hypothetical protein
MDTYGYIYITTNKINGNRYIGQHKARDWDSKYFGSGKLILKAIQKYGIENFTCFPLAWAWSKEELNQLEIDYIAHYKPEYNLTKGGDGTGGYIFTDEDKIKISKSLKGEKNGMYGKKHTPESIEKMSKKHKGNIFSEEHKRKISESKKGEKHHNFGKHLTKEYKRKISEYEKGEKNHFFGKKHTKETIKKMSEKHKLYWQNKKLNNIGEKNGCIETA